MERSIRTTYEKAVHHGGERELSDCHQIVLHSMESTNATGAAEAVGAWFKNLASGGSTHYGVDDDSIKRYLPLRTVAYGAPGLNEHGVHIEQMGKASWTRDQWMKHKGTLDNCAWLMARIHKRTGIPLRRLTDAELRAGKKGVTTHRQATRALGMGTHTDPGPNYPITYVVTKAKQYAAED